MSRSLPQAQPFFAHPLATLAAAFIVGILTMQVLPIRPPVCFSLAILFSLLALVNEVKARFRPATWLVCAAFVFAGAALASLEQTGAGADSMEALLDNGIVAAGEPVELTGVLERQPEAAPDSVYLTLRVETLTHRSVEKRVAGTVILMLPISGKAELADYENLQLRYGSRIRLMTELRRADNFRNPGGSSFKDYLDRNGLAASGFVKSPLLIDRIEDQPVFVPLAWLYRWREQLQKQINTHFAAETAGVLNASLLGNRFFLSHTAAEKFREGGTFHVLVISGLHISFLGGMVLVIARRVSRRRLTQFVLSVLVLWSYTLAVGAEASVVRAALMFTLVAFAPVVARRGASLNALGAAAIVLLVWRPGELFDPSFQLTFLSVLAIVALAWPLLRRMSDIGSWHPTRETPYPPSSPQWLRTVCELLFWEERKWQEHLTQLNYRYKLFKTPLAAKLGRCHLQGFLRYAFGAAVVSVCVQLTLLPLMILYFHRLSVSGLVLNVGVSLIMAVLIFTAIVALLIAQLSIGLAAPFVALTNLLDWLMVHGVDPFARLGIASLRLPEYTGSQVVVYVVFYVPTTILTLALASWIPLGRPQPVSRRYWGGSLLRIALVAQVFLVALIIAHPRSAAPPDGKLRIDFLDVGQGDAILVTMPDGTTLLVDGGGRPKFFGKKTGPKEEAGEAFERDTRSVGEAVVSEYLWWRGIDQIDYILATHADADHIDGLKDVARNFTVRAALVARMPASDAEYETFAETLNNQNIPVHLIAAGDELQFGSAGAAVLWPSPAANKQAPSSNNDSVVLHFKFGDRSILLTGDIERGAETALVKDLHAPNRAAELRADVVKVAHHGSRTSSTQGFVNAARPRFAVISVGQHSTFGHPHADVVARWRTLGAEVLTTGESGTITVTTDGRDLQVTKFVQK